MSKGRSMFLCLMALAILAACNNEGQTKVKEPETAVVQQVNNDTVTTDFMGVSPCKGCKQINTEVEFKRALKDSVGRFQMKEAYINKKDSEYQVYRGVGTYKVLPNANGEIKGVAVYNMILDDKTHQYLYLLQDSLTLLKLDSTGKPAIGDNLTVLKKTK